MSKTYSAGIVTAYGAAKRAGYQGTYEDFCRQQAGYAESAAAVEQAKTDAINAKNDAVTAKNTAVSAKDDAVSAKNTAVSAKDTAVSKASEASDSATSAGRSATNAAASATSAAQSASNAQDVLDSIPADYTDLSANVSQLKADLDVLNDGLTGDKVVQVQKSRSDLTTGILSKNGTVTSSTSAGYFTAPIEVSAGETITAKKAYYNSSGVLTGVVNTDIRACAYFVDNTFQFTSIGFNSATSSFTVPDGVRYIQPTFSGMMTGTYTQIIISRTTANGQVNQKLLDINNGTFPTKNLENNYGCALPRSVFRMTTGIPEKWYKKSMATPPTEFVIASGGYSSSEQETDGVYFENSYTISSTNGYIWKHYDTLLVLIEEFIGSTGIGSARRVISENLSNCSLLAIGDSTIDHDDLTAKLLSYFTSKNKTITLLGTRGSTTDPLNKNEGRAGWTTADYLANTTKNGYTNPFWNPSTQTFDFAYYMAQQGYSGVDFVVIQLGINDLYGSTTFPNIDITQTWDNIKTMIDSILSYNDSTKIILNLPTTPNAGQSEHATPEFLYRNRVIKYNEYAIKQSLAVYAEANVRTSYCHLILNPETDIRDNVHPTVAGYEKMAMEVINQINCWQNGV